MLYFQAMMQKCTPKLADSSRQKEISGIALQGVPSQHLLPFV